MTLNKYQKTVLDIIELFRRHTVGFVDENVPDLDKVYLDMPIAIDIAEEPERMRFALDTQYELPDSIDQKTRQFLTEAKHLYNMLHKSNKHREALVAQRPDVLVDICHGDGDRSRSYVSDLRRLWGSDIPLIAIDARAKELAKARDCAIPNTTYVLGTVSKNGSIEPECSSCSDTGVIEFSEELLVQYESKGLFAYHACDHVSDSIAKFCIKNDFDYFAIVRCCYDQLGERGFLSMPEISPLDHRVTSIIGSQHEKIAFDDHAFGSAMERILPKIIGTDGQKMYAGRLKVGNILLARLAAHAICHDLAGFMELNGYDAGVEKSYGEIVVHGSKR